MPRWLLFVLLFLGSFIVGQIFIFNIALDNAPSIIESNPYEKGLEYQTEINDHKELNAAGVKINARFAKNNFILKLTNSNSESIDDYEISIQALSAHSPSSDFKGTMKFSDIDKAYKFVTKNANQGTWWVKTKLKHKLSNNEYSVKTKVIN